MRLKVGSAHAHQKRNDQSSPYHCPDHICRVYRHNNGSFTLASRLPKPQHPTSPYHTPVLTNTAANRLFDSMTTATDRPSPVKAPSPNNTWLPTCASTRNDPPWYQLKAAAGRPVHGATVQIRQVGDYTVARTGRGCGGGAWGSASSFRTYCGHGWASYRFITALIGVLQNRTIPRPAHSQVMEVDNTEEYRAHLFYYAVAISDGESRRRSWTSESASGLPFGGTGVEHRDRGEERATDRDGMEYDMEARKTALSAFATRTETAQIVLGTDVEFSNNEMPTVCMAARQNAGS